MKKRTIRTSKGTWNPSRSYCHMAIEEYKDNGGKIGILKADNRNYEQFLETPSWRGVADEFLLGE